MAEQLFDEFGQAFSVNLIPASGGVFEIDIDNEPIYSKKATGRHAAYEDVAPAVRAALAGR